MSHHGAVCDRCSKPYASYTFPHPCLCPGCNLGSMSPWERGKLLGYYELTGEFL